MTFISTTFTSATTSDYSGRRACADLDSSALRQSPKQGLYLLSGCDVVPQSLDPTVGANEEHPRFSYLVSPDQELTALFEEPFADVGITDSSSDRAGPGVDWIWEPTCIGAVGHIGS